mgnify:CR=1 FL=1
MSETALEWKTSLRQPNRYVRHLNITPTPQRKSYFAEYQFTLADYPYIAFAKTARNAVAFADYGGGVPSGPTARPPETKYPLYLIQAFRVGSIAFAFGVILLLITIFFASDVLSIGGATFLALGSVTVVLTLLRGQDLDERNG